MGSGGAGSKATAPNASGTQQALTFEIGSEIYAVEILRVREIRGWTEVRKIPHAPPHVLGVLNLRGSIIPIVDLRMRFNLERAEYTEVTVIIVLSVQSTDGRQEVGVVVDGVSDVVNISAADIHQAPDFGSGFSTEYIRGLANVANRMVVLIDIDRLIGTQLTSLPSPQQGSESSVEAA